LGRKRSHKKKSKKRPPRKNPRTGRPTWYLGHRVPDSKKPGLDNPSEVKGITQKVLQDYKKGRISYKTAMSRLNLLKLIVKKDSDFRGKRKAYKIIDHAREKLINMRR